MTAFDYGVLAAVGMSAALGLWRGLVSEVLALAAWVVGFLAARSGAEAAGAAFSGVIAEPAFRHAAGFAVVLVATLVVFAIGRALLKMLLRAAGLGLADRLLGVGFGAVRGMLIVLVAVLLAGLTALPRYAWWQQAALAPPLETAVIAIKPWLPGELAKRIRYR